MTLDPVSYIGKGKGEGERRDKATGTVIGIKEEKSNIVQGREQE